MPIMDGFEATKSITKMIEDKLIEKLVIIGATANKVDVTLKR